MTYQEACKAILANETARALNYAVGYARHGATLQSGTEEAKDQSLYILTNITHWRGDAAKQVRAALKLEAGLK